jgi:hypothetical protein
MTERSESHGDQLAQLMSPELARNPQPAYAMLRESSPVENVLGWGGPIGIMLRGNYRVIDSGIGTGGVQWVALQAQPRA